MTIIIGLSGKMGTGKTTLADMICSRLPGGVRVSVAEPIRVEVAALLGVSVELVRKPAFKGMTFRIGSRLLTGREVLQWWGTEIRRAADPDYWTSKMEEWLDLCEDPLVVIDDVRTRDEARLFGGGYDFLYRLEPYPGWLPGENAGHKTETDLDGYHAFTRVFSPEHGRLDAVADVIVGDARRRVQELRAESAARREQELREESAARLQEAAS